MLTSPDPAVQSMYRYTMADFDIYDYLYYEVAEFSPNLDTFAFKHL